MNKTAVIVGATGEIGQAVTDVFINDGFRVCGTYFSDDDTAEKMTVKHGLSLVMEKLDVTDFSETERLYSEIYKEFGSISVNVYSAGIEISKLLAIMCPEEWNRIIDINLNGVYNCCRCVLKKMMPKEYGRIINISSAAASIPGIGQTAYAASKAGVNALTKALAKETARLGITVNAVAPGFTRGEMADKYSEKYKDIIPMKRFAYASEIAELVKFLASENAAYITGAVYTIDGGLGA